MPGKDVLDRSVSAAMKGKQRLLNSWMHDVTERMKIRRKSLARDAGLDDSYDVGTYPSEESNINMVVKGAGTAGILGSSVISGGLVAGGLWLGSQLLDKEVSEATLAEPIIEVIEKTKTRKYDYEVGTIKVEGPSQ